MIIDAHTLFAGELIRTRFTPNPLNIERNTRTFKLVKTKETRTGGCI